jgi:hypothetical protein
MAQDEAELAAATFAQPGRAILTAMLAFHPHSAKTAFT